MGFECGIKLRNKETKRDTQLFYFGRLPDNLDFKIQSISKGIKEEYEYLLDYYKVEHFVDNLKKFHLIYTTNSPRIMSEVEYYLTMGEKKPTDISKGELSVIKDVIYECDCDDLWKIENFYEIFTAINTIDDELLNDFDLIYWRSF